MAWKTWLDWPVYLTSPSLHSRCCATLSDISNISSNIVRGEEYPSALSLLVLYSPSQITSSTSRAILTQPLFRTTRGFIAIQSPTSLQAKADLHVHWQYSSRCQPLPVLRHLRCWYGPQIWGTVLCSPLLTSLLPFHAGAKTSSSGPASRELTASHFCDWRW